MDYENMSDFEINKRVAENLNPNAINFEYDWGNTEGRKKSKRGVIVVPNGGRDAFLFNPCNNPSDAWPIIQENMISLQFHTKDDDCGDKGDCRATNGNFWHIDEYGDGEYFVSEGQNPLRAACIVYLMMQKGA